MSQAWETTEDDVAQVLTAHGIRKTPEELSEIHGNLDHDQIESIVLTACNMDDQVQLMLNDIEEQLMEDGVIPKGDTKFSIDELTGECECDEDEG